MFGGPRKSITQIASSLFIGQHDEPVIGKEISRPTHSFATRAWAANTSSHQRTPSLLDSAHASSMNPNHIAKHSQAMDSEQMQTELRHAHMSLLAERARVQELEGTLKTLMEQKYSNQSSIIDQLRSSQDKLREQLQFVIQSKMDLCESTALEIERLRIIIAELTNHLTEVGGQTSAIDIEKIMNKYNDLNLSNYHKLIPVSAEQKLQKMDTAAANVESDERDLEEVLNEPLPLNPSLPRHLRAFPHRDISRIDIRTIERGDGSTYPDPFAAVDLKYTGYKYSRESREWTKFTSSTISSTVFETRLGNHENIIGLEQAVLSMTKGEMARVWVPSRLGYGVHGAEPLIPPNTDLVFELTLVEIRNDYAMAGPDDTDPLDPHQMAHIQREDMEAHAQQDFDMDADEEMDIDAVHSNLTANNLNTLNSLNQNNQNHSNLNQGQQNHESENINLLYEEDEYSNNQQNSFQVL